MTNGSFGWRFRTSAPRIHVFHGTLVEMTRADAAGLTRHERLTAGLPRRELLRRPWGGGVAEALAARHATVICVSDSTADQVSITWQAPVVNSKLKVGVMFAAADTVVLPYRVASQSGVLLLAYGFRRPVIVYPVGGLIEAVVDGETGWICARPDVDALADALNASASAGWMECRRRGEAGYHLAHERYGWEAIATRTDRLYSEVLQTPDAVAAAV